MICLLYTFFQPYSDFINCFALNPEEMYFCHSVTFHDVTSSCFPSLVPCKKTGNWRKPHFKASDVGSENICSLIRLSVSDGKKTDSSKDVSFISI